MLADNKHHNTADVSANHVIHVLLIFINILVSLNDCQLQFATLNSI